MTFYWELDNKTALFMATEKENFDIVKFLLENNEIDVNAYSILNKNL